MTQEDRYLLIKDLSARLPYRVLVHYCNKKHTLYTNDFVLDERLLIEFRCSDCCVELKPYLRPLSSMTEEEKKEYCDLQDRFLCSSQYPVTEAYALFDWLNKNHFDFRGLIPKGLAIEVTKDNPYK